MMSNDDNESHDKTTSLNDNKKEKALHILHIPNPSPTSEHTVGFTKHNQSIYQSTYFSSTIDKLILVFVLLLKVH
jgi:hypothetical protein